MTLNSFALDILKFTLSGIGVVWAAFYMVKPYLDRDEKLQLIELKKAISNQTLPLRLQAYERLVLFIERANPANLLIRLNASAYTTQDLYSLIVQDIRNEYQHNITQQLYVSGRAWAVVKRVKDDTLGIVNNAKMGLPETATGLELAKAIIVVLSALEDNPYDIGASLLKKDLEELF